MAKSKYLLITLLAMTFTACDELLKKYIDTSDYAFLTDYFEEKDSTSMEVVGLTFSPDYKTFTVSTRMCHDGPTYQLEDSLRVRTEVVETIDGLRYTKRSTPKLIEMRNVEAEGVKQNEVRLLVLVDLSLPQPALDRVATYVSEMQTVFDRENLFVAFMDGEKVSRTMKVTDYLLNAYFKHSDTPYVFLYRSMQNKREEMMHGKGLWEGSLRRVMITFSGDVVYDEETGAPIDPDHYRFEEQLIHYTRSADSTFLAYYVSMNRIPEDNEDNGQNVPWVFCSNNGGAYMKDFRWVEVKRMMYNAFHFDFPDNEFTFVNPDYKVYRGDDKQLTLNFYDRKTNAIVASFSTTVTMGKVYQPIIVHGHSIYYVIAQGVMLTILLLLIIYLVMQFIVPLIRYFIFRRRYVIAYTGANMSVKGKAVGQSCYLCKAPFVPGDNIVVKCEHTMHESCWEENEYHCPEYPDRCRQGSHYFNKENPFDSRNASFYMRWVLLAISSAALAWLGFLLYVHFRPDGGFMQRFMSPPVSQVPFLGGVSGLFLTMGLSVFAVSSHGWRRLTEVLARSSIAAVACYAAFFIINILILAFDIERGISVLNGLPWIASGFIIALCATCGTRVVYNRLLVLLTFGLGLLSLGVWVLFYQRAELDFRVLLLLSFVIYSVGMAISVATVAPRSERFFLKVQGAVKEMDVALYKWFRNHPGKVVTIGKSVDCSLQLSWDVQSAVAPVQAEIRMIRKSPFLIALEPGVFMKNRPVKVDHKVRLFHGKSFTIGQTTFTYIEKDR